MMVMDDRRFSGTMQRLVLLALVLMACLQLASCAASTAAEKAAAQPDIVTQSDEPQDRTRARIRLELAVGYFEQGKTTIALDEPRRRCRSTRILQKPTPCAASSTCVSMTRRWPSRVFGGRWRSSLETPTPCTTWHG